VFQSTRPVRDATQVTKVDPRAIVVSIHASRAGRDLARCFASPARHGFNPRVPCGTRRAFTPDKTARFEFQSTRPVRDATTCRATALVWRPCFNPRVPCGTRLQWPQPGALVLFVSIHASRAGRDRGRAESLGSGTSFNPRVPCGTRRVDKCYSLTPRVVSIHASRAGRDSGPSRPWTWARWVSIHASRAGRDKRELDRIWERQVSIHASRAGRDLEGVYDNWLFSVSIHASRAGRDEARDDLGHRQVVSIHASRAGRDIAARGGKPLRPCFNPRVPCGTRRGSRPHRPGDVMFQSTRPVRDATPRARRSTLRTQVSIHASRAGRDTKRVLTWKAKVTFQSTRPVRDATLVLNGSRRRRSVSIHASRAGRDVVLPEAIKIYTLFQSTRPVRDATGVRGGPHSDSVFQSTRPVRDATLAVMSSPPCPGFQSTRPVRDATKNRILGAQHRYGFNPRVPCGTRLRSRSTNSKFICFNPRVPCGTRPVADKLFLQGILFQSTRPVRDATRTGRSARRAYRVSIHASRAGRDRMNTGLRSCSMSFNPRVPCGTRRGSLFRTLASIRFNPRVPCGTRQGRLSLRPGRSPVSIHASRAGRDPATGSQPGDLAMFQSTRPVRDATGFDFIPPPCF